MHVFTFRPAIAECRDIGTPWPDDLGSPEHPTKGRHVIGPLEALIKALKGLPGVGEKTATRYAFYILNAKNKEIQDLISAVKNVRAKLRLCSTCFHLTDVNPCGICSDARRDVSRICVVETPLDLLAVVKGGNF